MYLDSLCLREIKTILRRRNLSGLFWVQTPPQPIFPSVARNTDSFWLTPLPACLFDFNANFAPGLDFRQRRNNGKGELKTV